MTSPSEEGFEVVVEEVEWIDPTPPKRAKRRRPTPPPAHPSLPALIESAVQEVKNYFESQLELLQLKLKRAANQAAASIVMIVAAVLFALLLLWWTFHTAEVALALVVPEDFANWRITPGQEISFCPCLAFSMYGSNSS